MTKQWFRECNLIVGDGGEAMNVSALRCRFTVVQATTATPGHADIWINNLADTTANKIRKEYDRVVLQAGYPGNLATIFEGEIVQKRKGRENPTDTYLNILAKEGQKAYSYAVISKTLAAGHTFRDQVDACLETLKPFGIAAGFIADLGQTKMPRGRAMFGMVREQLRWICASTDTHWRITGNKLEIVKNGETRPGDAVVLNSRTGLIGMPTQTMGGIEVRCLLNPQIKPGSLVKIDQASIQTQQISLNYGAQAQNEMIPPIDADGLYKVIRLIHHGDTRGTDWYTDITCLSLSNVTSGKPVIPPHIKQSLPSVLGI